MVGSIQLTRHSSNQKRPVLLVTVDAKKMRIGDS